MNQVLNVLLMVVSIMIIVIVLLQKSKSDDIASALTGNYHQFVKTKERGQEAIVTRITTVLVILFFLLAILKYI